MSGIAHLNLTGTGLEPEDVYNFLRSISRDPQRDRVKTIGNPEYISAFDPAFLNICWRVSGYYEDKIDTLLKKYHDQDVEKIEHMDHGQQEVPFIWNKKMLKERLSLQGLLFACTGLYAYREPKNASVDISDENFTNVGDAMIDYKIHEQTFIEAQWNYWGYTFDQNTAAASVEAAKTWMDEKYKTLERFPMPPAPQNEK